MDIIEKIKFDSNGLVPVITQSAKDNEVLMLAYMNAESIQITLDTKRVTYYSRSRQELWEKGLTSGNTQELVSMELDCDGDTILVKVNQTGPACHTGANNCFLHEIV